VRGVRRHSVGREHRRERPPKIEPARFRKVPVVGPAHDQLVYAPRNLKSLERQEYPKTRFRVADNCTDGTVVACRAFDVDVLERSDVVNWGRGHAIRWALERLEPGRFDVLVVIDSGSFVEERFLTELKIQMERGDRVIQRYNGVANPDECWFTRWVGVSRTIANEIIHPGKPNWGRHRI
jgi:hypothetical protein